MRNLSDTFVNNLKNGFLWGLNQRAINDTDLDIQIRSNYINIYYKGNSLLKLTEFAPDRYRIELHPKFTQGVTIADLIDESTTQLFLDQIPFIKENILKYGESSLEVEFEQMIIRSNNYEPRNNSEYFILDRQITAGKEGRFDLTGIYWKRSHRRKDQEVPLSLIEVKYALNPDIQNVHDQLSRYYQAVHDKVGEVAEEAECLLKQKIDLGHFTQPSNRLAAMKTLTISKDIDHYQFILILIDYNPYSSLLNIEKLNQLPFVNQLKIFKTGFAMWQANLKPLGFLEAHS
jgi:hypothetical protein